MTHPVSPLRNLSLVSCSNRIPSYKPETLMSGFVTSSSKGPQDLGHPDRSFHIG